MPKNAPQGSCRFRATCACYHDGVYYDLEKNPVYTWVPGHGAPSTHMAPIDKVPEACAKLIKDQAEIVRKSREAVAQGTSRVSLADRLSAIEAAQAKDDRIAALEAKLAAAEKPDKAAEAEKPVKPKGAKKPGAPVPPPPPGKPGK